jgi:hypothetical protein
MVSDRGPFPALSGFLFHCASYNGSWRIASGENNDTHTGPEYDNLVSFSDIKPCSFLLCVGRVSLDWTFNSIVEVRMPSNDGQV